MLPNTIANFQDRELFSSAASKLINSSPVTKQLKFLFDVKAFICLNKIVILGNEATLYKLKRHENEQK